MHTPITKPQVGIIGWRGLVGSVLIARLREENDFNYFTPHFFSTSQKNLPAPDVGQPQKYLLDAFDLDQLAAMDIILTCQGGAYTTQIYHQLRQHKGWEGIWLDSASTLRMNDDSIIVLDIVNQAIIDEGLARGIKTFVGGNCTVNIMLLALKNLFAEKLIEWVSIMTYQAASGAGSKAMQELLKQIQYSSQHVALTSALPNALDAETALCKLLQTEDMPTDAIGAPLLGNLVPWIDTEMQNGQSKEEWKAMQEVNKILQSTTQIPIDGTCVRIGAFRAHSLALTIKLNKPISLSSIEHLIQTAHPWIKWVPNSKEKTLRDLTPLAVSGTLDIAVGRVRKLSLGDNYLNMFIVGDQLLWGAAEPLRRILHQLVRRNLHLS